MTKEIKLSYSSSNMLLGCSQKYWHYKVNQTPKDKDFEEDNLAFNIGKAFHYILEQSLHGKPENVEAKLRYCQEAFSLNDDECHLVYGMILKYLAGSKLTNLKTIACEVMIEHPVIFGFIDAIQVDVVGKWWITDLKTASSISENLKAKLPRDRQLNLYSYYAPEVSQKLNLKLEDFGGCRYRVVTKPKIKKKESESIQDYILRIKESAKFRDFVILKDELDPQGAYELHAYYYKQAVKLHSGKLKPVKNYNFCEQYFKTCEYFSQCHGKCASEMSITEFGLD
jgi:hypothetical protein